MTPEKLAEGKRLVEAAKATGLDETSTTRENGDAKRWLLANARDLLAAEERAQRAEALAGLLREQNASLAIRVRRAEERLKQIEPEPGKSSWVARADYDAALARLRETAQILIEYTGADGPMNAEDAARRAVGKTLEDRDEGMGRIEFLKEQRDTAERERDEARSVLREFEWEACSETLPNYDGPNIVQCRVCHGRRDGGGHAAGCRVERALGGGK